MRNAIEGLVVQPKVGRCAQNAYASLPKNFLTLKAFPDLLSGLVASKTAQLVLLLLVLGLCAVSNLPWHLDNYDQAKQAYVSYEIAHGGDWF